MGTESCGGGYHEVTAVEFDPKIAKVYQDNFPQDTVIIGDAHQYLLDHFRKFDFIWSSPPCPSHSRARFAGSASSKEWAQQRQPAIYPDMKLYEEILLLQGYFKGKYCIENVRSWYKPLIQPQEVALHYFWANFEITPLKLKSRGHYSTVADLEKSKGFDLSLVEGLDKRKVLRNCVEPETGLHIFNCLLREENETKKDIQPIN